jgi:hypothetical protein
MGTQEGIQPWDTVAEFMADTSITQHEGNEVILKDVLDPGVTHVAYLAGAEVPDGKFSVRKTNDASLTFWASSINKQIADAENLAYPSVRNSVHQNISIAVAAAEVGESYDFGVASGLPVGVELTIQPVVVAGTIPFIIKNKSGATITPGNIVVNIYK